MAGAIGITAIKSISFKYCLNCGVSIEAEGNKKFCSHNCYSKNKVGKKHSWGFKISRALSGKKKSKTHVENVRKALTGRKRPEISGELNVNWKGDSVGYYALHDWVYKVRGRPKSCEHCGKNAEMTGGIKTRVNVHWANKSHAYKREVSDWISLCVPCHRQYDK